MPSTLSPGTLRARSGAAILLIGLTSFWLNCQPGQAMSWISNSAVAETRPDGAVDAESDPNAQPYEGTTLTERYRLAWSDEFEGSEIDESKWYYRTGSKLWSTQLPANNSVSEGLFRIHLKKEKSGGKEYTGGGIISKKLFRYGYYEASMKVPPGQGWHSSFWMMRDKVLADLPKGSTHIELDPVENDSSDPFHFQIDAHRWLPGPHRKFGTKQIHPTTPLTEFHVYGLEFTPTELRYFFDGELIGATDASIFAHNDVNVWLSCLAGKLGNKTTAVDDSKLPAETQYGYFRFFEKAPHGIVEILSPDPGSGVGLSDTAASLKLVARIAPSTVGLAPVVGWTKVSGPGTVSFGDASCASTEARFSEPGHYRIECSATVGSVRNSAPLSVSVGVPIVLKLSHKLHGHISPATDIRESDPEHNNGQDDLILVGKWKDKKSRGLISFDLSRVAQGSQLESIELSFWSREGLGREIGAIELRALQGDFVEGTGDGWRLPRIGSGASWVSRTGSDGWQKPGGDFGAVVLSRMAGFDTSIPARKVFPSTKEFLAAAQRALDSRKPLGLVLISPETESGKNALAQFASNDSPEDLRPVLTLIYREPGKRMPRRKPNVLFIAVDDLRTELGCYGSAVAITPNFDKLAGQGLLFERAYCQQAICGPSRASILTGARPDTIGITHNYVKIRELNPDIVTLPQHFGANGYQTVYMGKIFHHGDLDPISWNRQPSVDRIEARSESELMGFALAKNREATEQSQREMFDKYGPVSRFGLAMGPAYECADVPDNTYIDGYNTDLAIATLKDLVKAGDEPFFLALGFNKPHLNWIAPKRYWDLYDRERIPMAENTDPPESAPAMGLHASFELRVRQGIPKEGKFDPELERTLKHAYLACVSYVDAQLGRMIAALEEAGVRDNTIIIVWSDHGFHLDDMGIWGKATNYEIATRVPLLIWTPDMPKGARGKTTDALVELVDIYPTLSGLAGLNPPPHLEGTSFAPLLRNPGQAWKTAAFSQFPNPALREWGAYPLRPAMRETFFGPLIEKVEGRIQEQFKEKWDRDLFENRLMGYAMRTDRYRLVAWLDTGNPDAEPVAIELYDHALDPEETRNIANEAPAVVAKLLPRLKQGWKGSLPGSLD